MSKAKKNMFLAPEIHKFDGIDYYCLPISERGEISKRWILKVDLKHPAKAHPEKETHWTQTDFAEYEKEMKRVSPSVEVVMLLSCWAFAISKLYQN